MKILTIDTSCKTAMAVLSENGNVISAVQLYDNKTHSVKMLPAVEYILAAAETKPDELSAVAVTNGPGSYTGLRIGVTTAKTLAYTMNIPLFGINTLEALAASCDFGGEQGNCVVCPMLDARNARVYGALYKNGKILQETVALECSALCDIINEKINDSGERVIFTGDGVFANKQIIIEKIGDKCQFVPTEFSFGNPQALACVAAKKYSEAAEAGKLAEYTAESLRVDYYKNYTDTI